MLLPHTEILFEKLYRGYDIACIPTILLLTLILELERACIIPTHVHLLLEINVGNQFKRKGEKHHPNKG
jgi:hypothetical protein